MSVELSRRMGVAAWIGRATPAERDQLADALAKADTFEELPAQVQRLLVRLERGRP